MRNTFCRQFEQKVFDYMDANRMLSPADHVVAGVSGGADSVCLLFVLSEWKKRFGLELAVAHVNHGIRAEAEADARFVENLCGEHGIPFVLYEADIPALAKEWKCSEEEAGRIFRYRAFSEAAGERGAAKIAVAHNQNDRAETVLFHLFRGSGVKGLAGICPVREKIIRPLLCAERREIEEYLRQRGQDYRTDATNEEDAYSRNKIRHHILPYAEKELVSGCVRHIAGTAEQMEETEDYLAGETGKAMESCAVLGDGFEIDLPVFSQYHTVLQKRMLHEMLLRLAPGAKDIFQIHVDDMLKLIRKSGNGRIDLPFALEARKEYDKVFLGRRGGENRGKSPEKETFRMEFEQLDAKDLPRDRDNSLLFPQNKYTKWFDYDKIKRCPILRYREEGDFLMIRGSDGKPHRKKLQDYFVTEKIPAAMRESIPVIAVDSHVAWLVGYRISEAFKVDETTARVLQVTVVRE